MSGAFDDGDALKKIAVNLFYGWGYNFYRVENQLRADDLMVRAQVGALLGRARASVEQAESAWRRERIATPTREKPLPDPAVIEGARQLEALSRALGALEGQIRAQPVPEADHMTNRYRRETETLQRLCDADAALVGRAEILRGLVEDATPTQLRERAQEIDGGLHSLARGLRERQALLLGA
jgi:hypothetical protein